MPKDPYVPPSTVQCSLPSQQAFSSQLISNHVSQQQATPHPQQATPLQQHPQQATPSNPPGMPQPTSLRQQATPLHPPGMPHPIIDPAQHATPLHPPSMTQQRAMAPMMGSFLSVQQLQYYLWQQQQQQRLVYPSIQIPPHSSWHHRQPSEHAGHTPIPSVPYAQASYPSSSYRPPATPTPFQFGAQAPTDRVFQFGAPHYTLTSASNMNHTPCPAKATVTQNGVGGSAVKGGGVKGDVGGGGDGVGGDVVKESPVKWSVVEPSTDELLEDISTPPSSDSTPLSSDSEDTPPYSDCTLEQLMVTK